MTLNPFPPADPDIKLTDFAVQLLTKPNIGDRIHELGKEIAADLPRGQPASFFWIANGAIHQYSDLSRLALFRDTDLLTEAVRARSYHGVSERRPVEHDMDEMELAVHKGRRIYLLDDVLDTGSTLHTLCGRIAALLPGTAVRTVAFIEKVGCQTHQVPLDFCGFRVFGKPWLTGYGMDTYNRWRNMPGVWASDVQQVDGGGARPVKPDRKSVV